MLAMEPIGLHVVTKTCASGHPQLQHDSHIPGYTKSDSAALKIIIFTTCLFSASTGRPGFVYYPQFGEINHWPDWVLGWAGV
jgi:hypothetical protein